MDYEKIKKLLRSEGRPLKFNEMLEKLGVDRNELSIVLDDVVEGYSLIRTKKGA
jgi:hypothetical protein